ncbi:MAG TPA: DMT family transporter [Chloroflexota bacterium]|nr:DMT family transporter [Chloroflexota bacterium]
MIETLRQRTAATGRPWRSYLAAIVASVLWGSLYPAGKPAIAAVGPLQVVLCRALLACLTMGAIVVLRGDARTFAAHVRKRWPGILGVAGTSFFGTSLLAMLSLGLLPASVEGLLNNTSPLWLAVGTALLFPPRRPFVLVVGSLAALGGVGLIFFPDVLRGSLAVPTALNPLGVVLALTGSGLIAASTVVGRKVMLSGDPVAISALASGAAVPLLAALVLANGGVGPILAASLEIKALLLYVGVGCTATNFTLWFYALQHLPAAQAAAFQYLIPPVSVILAALTLGEPLTAALIVGGSLIVCGLVATQFSGR